MPRKACFECGKASQTNHHVIPRVRGGTKTVPLCTPCHEKAHGIHFAHSDLIKEGMARAKKEGRFWGQKKHHLDAKILALHALGFTHRKIGRLLRCSHTHVNSVCKAK